MSTVVHKLVAYSRETDAQISVYPIPSALMALVRDIAHIPDGDELALGAYKIPDSSVGEITRTMGVLVPADADIFVEPYPR